MRALLFAWWMSVLVPPLEAQEQVDPAFDTSVDRPSFRRGSGPVVLFDQAHRNVFTLEGQARAFANLLTSDGFRVRPNTAILTDSALQDIQVLVIATARGWSADSSSAFLPSEIDTVYEWVRGGGSLFLMTGHHPFDTSMRSLAHRFGIRVSIGVVGDSANYDRTSANPLIGSRQPPDQWIVFTWENNLLREHPITQGRAPSERLRRVLIQGGNSISGNLNSVEFLSLAPTATNRSRSGVGPIGMERAQALAFELGEGRIVALGDATAITAQIVHPEGGPPFRLGMSRTDFDNRQFVLNTIRWLGRVF